MEVSGLYITFRHLLLITLVSPFANIEGYQRAFSSYCLDSQRPEKSEHCCLNSTYLSLASTEFTRSFRSLGMRQVLHSHVPG